MPRSGLAAWLLVLATAASPVAAVDATPLDRAHLGTGRVVWESNRSGAFRIWGRSFAGEPAHQLSRDQPGRDHCCVRLSPDGERLVYLSIPGGSHKYLPPSVAGEIHLLRLADGDDRVLSRRAHHYGEHRAFEWWSPTTLVYLDVDGTTRQLDLARGTNVVIARSPPGSSGWLVDPTGRHAVDQGIGFAERDAATGAIHPVTPFGGCQNEIAAQGDLGYWAAGAGGPIDVVDLATWTTRILLDKHDPRLPADRGYLYFPMLSRDRTLLAFGASHDEHDHFRADYDIFLIELDPRRLVVRGGPIRVSSDPSVDRFPDVWRGSAPSGDAPAVPAPTPRSVSRTPVFVWSAAQRRGPGHDIEAGDGLTARGAASIDGAGILRLAGGEISATAEAGERVLTALRGSNAMTLALVVEPRSLSGDASGPIVALATSPRRRCFLVIQSGDRIELVLRTADRGGPAGGPPIELARLPDRRAHHVAFRFSPPLLEAFLDGRPTARVRVQGGFFHWRNGALLVGAEPGATARFRGAVAELSIWDRELDDAELATDAGGGVAAAARGPEPGAAPKPQESQRTRDEVEAGVSTGTPTERRAPSSRVRS